MPLYMRTGKLRGPHMKKSMPMGPFRTQTEIVNVGDVAAKFPAGARPQAGESAHMNRLMAIGAAAIVTAGASAQDAVQWRVEDGGNGHWYGVLPDSVVWSVARQQCEGRGGHLATLTSRRRTSLQRALSAQTRAGSERSSRRIPASRAAAGRGSPESLGATRRGHHPRRTSSDLKTSEKHIRRAAGTTCPRTVGCVER